MSTRSRSLDIGLILSLPTLFGLACSSDTPAASGSAGPTGLAVVHGSIDYTSSLLSLVDPATATLAYDNCLNSGSLAPQLSQALSGGVVLPSSTASTARWFG